MVQTTKPHVVQTAKPHVFIDHIIYREGEALPPISPDNLYEYVIAQNGVFVRSERAGLSAVIPVLSNQYITLRGLAELNPEVSLGCEGKVGTYRTNPGAVQGSHAGRMFDVAWLAGWRVFSDRP